MKKIYIKAIMIFLIILVFVIPKIIKKVQIYNGTKDFNGQTITKREDIEPLKEMIVFLDGNENCNWNIYSYGKYSIGLNDRRYNGFIILNEEKEFYKKEYNFKETEINVDKNFDEFLEDADNIWYYSEEFNNDMVKEFLIGNLYFNEKFDILYFELNQY